MDKKNQNLLIWAVIAIVVVLTGVTAIVMHHSDIPYKLTAEQTLSEITKTDNMPGIAEIGALKSNQKVAFIDVRNPLDYNLNHIEGAINIPAEKILNDDFVESINELETEGNIIILYGTTPGQAAGPWMLLKQIGITNVRMFNGSYDQLSAAKESSVAIYNEVPVIDTALLKKDVIKQESPVKAASKPKPVIPQRVEPAAESGGGC